VNGWCPDTLEALLPNPTTARRPPGRPGGTYMSIPDQLPRYLAQLVDQPPNGDRSRQLWHLVCIAVESGLDAGSVHDLAVRHRPSVEKYGERLAGEVDRILAKRGAL
jgi:hypothetical protein